ncbi:hypothetical protein AUEXF2481DRAFT_471577 [Aureobasidium subglaciale EXF-2481]|uniref:Uncharacterized protein n=1 Tax=Aureobasidium subglaciale (strain EXF-2481) TaxID=1043005 RepID=A0A074YPW3_AURSE|nr:uncharacterized protein AUEXF2481DRAFT_471577 [Aureobasidium subglaciale EXF-2481]KEQ98164.1 hypothetical protein AUEXF2481DRAFT_471577 [Aureobasidium subglaciale EXF-2481]
MAVGMHLDIHFSHPFTCLRVSSNTSVAVEVNSRIVTSSSYRYAIGPYFYGARRSISGPHVLSKGSKWSSASALILFEGWVHNCRALKPTLQRFLRSERLLSHMQLLLQMASLPIASDQAQTFRKVFPPHFSDVCIYTNSAVIYHVLNLQIPKLQSHDSD